MCVSTEKKLVGGNGIDKSVDKGKWIYMKEWIGLAQYKSGSLHIAVAVKMYH